MNVKGVPAVAVRMLLLVLAGALLAPCGIGGHAPLSAAAQKSGLTIPVYDYTTRWGKHIEAGVAAWDAALAPRGIRLTYSRQTPTLCEQLNQPASGISICETALPPTDHRWAGEFQGIWASQSGIQMQGIARFFEDPQNTNFDDMVVCHEIGHTLWLSHVAQGTDSCMAPVPNRSTPSAWDSANALLDISDVVELPIGDGRDGDVTGKKLEKKEAKAKAKAKKARAKDKEQAKKKAEKRRKRHEERDHPPAPPEDGTRLGEPATGIAPV